jgi:membrane-bound lytic murein transglycosylase D
LLLAGAVRLPFFLLVVVTTAAGCATVRLSPTTMARDATPSVEPGAVVAERAKPRATPTSDALLPCAAHPRIDAWEDAMRSMHALRAANAQGLARGAAYLPRLRAQFTAAGLPPSLALLPLIESSFRADANERGGGGRGLWQLMPGTARRFGLVVRQDRDDRVHPERSTEAAARYLALLYEHYGDWALALAAYNAGEQRVDRALASHPRATFWELADRGMLPETSRDFVPRFLAVVRMTDGVEVCTDSGI